jgi:predicted DNA-binding transcriptional regulator AlpA
MAGKNPNSDLVSAKVVGDMLGLGNTTFRNLSSEGFIPSPVISIPRGKRVILRWSRSEILAFIEKKSDVWGKRGDK